MPVCLCLYDLIGISQACDELDQCTRYINDLPGIEAGMFEDLTSSDRKLYTDILDKVKRRTVNSFYTEMIHAFRKKFVPNLLLEDVITGRWYQPFEALPVETKLRGVAISLRISKYLELHAHSVEIYVENSPLVNASIYIYDLERGILLDTILFSAPTDGFYTIELDKRYMEYDVGIFYDCEEIETRRTTYYDESYYREICKPCGCMCTSAMPVSIDKGEQVIRANLESGSYPGLIAKYHVGCSLENFLCQRKEALADPLLYKMGIEFFIELLASPRINITTLIPKEKLDALMSYCKANYDKGIETFVNGVTINDPLCMICKAPVQKAFLKL